MFGDSLATYLTRLTRFANSRALWLLAISFLLASASGRTLPGVKVGELSNAPSDYVNSTEAAEGSHSPAFNRVGIYVVGFLCAPLLIVTISVMAVLYLRHKRKMAAVSPYWRKTMSGQLHQVLETSVPLLRREEVETACEDFSNIIDSSPDSVVYKGTLANGTEIAATSLHISTTTWEPQSELAFRARVKELARMNHPHLVNLIGYCSQEEPWTRIFIFEYASNGTLYDHLHNKESEHLNWAARMRVIVGAAYGLRYMHDDICPPVNHASFGAEAVYLTDDYAAKVSNAGAIRAAVARNDSQKHRWFALKTVGYNDPESSGCHDPDLGSNVHGFGVFLLEVITGRLPHDEQGASLVDWAAEYLTDPKMMWYIVDPSLKSYNHDELVALCKIVTLCLKTDTHRPSMLKVAEMLADVLRLTPELVAAKSTASLWAQLELQDDTSEP